MATPKCTLDREQRELLARTGWDNLKKAFPGYPRRILAAWRKEARVEFPTAAAAGAAIEREARLSEAAHRAEQAALLEERDKLRRELHAMRKVFAGTGYKEIRISARGKKREATAVALASDWHCEELVTSEETNGLNSYNLSVFDRRSDLFFRNLAKLVNKEQHDAIIRNAVLWLGGDLMSGNIHEELMETNQLGPMAAAIRVQKKIAGGIRYLLEHTDVSWFVPCSVGNHERITKKRRIKTAVENSLATFVYYSLAAQFEGEKRVTFRLPDAYHTYADVHGYTLRFHHGDAVRYKGGLGGLTIPLKKKTANWNRARRADLDLLGHFHQFFDGGSFVVNGSLIGFSSYAIEIGAEYEDPRQAFLLIDSRHGKTGVFPVLVTE